MVNSERLRKKIENIDHVRNCSLRFESAEKLVEKVNKKYKESMSGEAFVNLVVNCAKELELSYNYCRVAFAYFGGNKKKEKQDVQKSKSTEHLQEAFPFDKKVIFTRTEITK